jgi:hypothetical protein
MALSAEQKVLHDRMVAAKERHEKALMEKPWVQGIGVAFRQGAGGAANDLVIRIYVHGDGGTGRNSLPSEIEGFPVEVVEGHFRMEASAAPGAVTGPDKKRYDPLLGGISMAPSRSRGGSGTLGLMVSSNRPGEDAMMLSNYHVMCLSDGKREMGDEMCQEARADNKASWCGNCAALSRWYGGDIQVGGVDYGVDAAVAVKTAREARLSEIVSIGRVSGIADPEMDMIVQKRGRTTELTMGKIAMVSFLGRSNFGPPIGQVLMSNQIVVEGMDGAFSAGGDSGSVYVEVSSKKVVGLHNGAVAEGSVGSWIKAVVKALDISI